MEKISKRNMYVAIATMAAEGGSPWFKDADGNRVEVSESDLLAFAEHEIELLDKKAVKAKENAAKKSAANDELTDLVMDALSEEFEPAADIALRVDAEDVSIAKIQYRLGKLVEAGKAEKTDMKIPATETSKARTVKAYRRIVAD